MLRITTWRLTAPTSPETTPQTALKAFDEMCNTLGKIPGAGHVRYFFGSGGIVTVGEPENYAAADQILARPEAHTAVAKVLGLGYQIVDDQFWVEPRQVEPFFRAAETVAAGRTSYRQN